MKPLKAYSVQGNEYGTVVFACHGITARREGANELNIEFDEVESCRRAPELDCYAETGSVPWRILVEQHDWSQECGYCQCRVHNETLGRVWATDNHVFCSTECEARMENLTRKYTALNQQHAEGE